jgi:hypothetical protein
MAHEPGANHSHRQNSVLLVNVVNRRHTMRYSMRRAFAALSTMVFLLSLAVSRVEAAKPLSVDDLVKLIELQIDDSAIIGKIKKEGAGFPVTDAALEKLRDAGASAKVLEAVRGAGKPKQPPAGGKAVSYADVVKLLDLGIDEQEILKRLEKSPTLFTLGADQVDELKKKGAGATLLAALQGKRAGGASPSGDVTDFVIILDCSGSMKARTKDGQMKMAAAKKVVTELIQNIPDGLNVAFMVYGHEVFSRLDDPRNCQAVKVVRSLSEIDAAGKQELAAFIHKLQPTGATPIALALRTAAAELARNDAFCGLVLITDGMESCKGDPDAEAAKLAENPKLTFGLNIIGFDVDGKEQAAVEGIAKAAGDKGKYYNAKTAADLKDMVGKIHKDLQQASAAPEQRDTRKYSAGGKAVKPGTFFHDAPAVKPDDYKGELAFMQAHYYMVPVKAGEELRVIAQVQKANYQAQSFSNSNINQTFSITIYNQDLAPVMREKTDVKDNPTTPSSVRALWTPETDGWVYVAVAASDNHNGNGEPVTVDDGAKVKGATYTLKIKHEGTAEAGQPLKRLNAKAGAAFDAAGELEAPGMAATDLKLGEVVFYRFKAEKGETFQVSAGIQKPWYSAHYVAVFSIEAKYTLTVYDDDQVQVASKELKIPKNPPDGYSFSVECPVTISGNVYVSLACENSGGALDTKDPKPGRVVVQVTGDAPGAAADGKNPFRGVKADSK